MGSIKALLAYGLYALLATVVFLFLLFPDDAVKAYINSRLTAGETALAIQADTIRPTLPPGLSLGNMVLTRNDQTLAAFDSARLSPELLSLFSEEKRLRYHAKLADGSVSGWAAAGASGLMDAEADLAGIQLDQLDLARALERFTLSGQLSGRLVHQGGRSGTAEGQLAVNQLRVALNTPFFGISEVLMDKVEADIAFSGRTVRLESVIFSGPMAQGSVAGTIALRDPIAKSRISLTGNAKPRPELFAQLQNTMAAGAFATPALAEQGLNFRIAGTLDSPNFALR